MPNKLRTPIPKMYKMKTLKTSFDTVNTIKDSSVCVKMDSSILSDSGESWFKLIIVVYLYKCTCM